MNLAFFLCGALGSTPGPADAPRRVMAVIALHPDQDEASSGGLVADAAVSGQEVAVLSTTAGELGAAGKPREEKSRGPRREAPVPLPKPREPQSPDWARLDRYRAENARVGPPDSAERRVVFFGDSITEAWVFTAPAFFQDRPYLGRGIGGQTTAQMLLRFRQDVIDLGPKAVVILAGTNDIAGNTGPYRQEDTFANVKSMVELATDHGIRAVLASVLPARDFPWSPGRDPATKIAALNALLREYAGKNGLVFLDYYAAMADAKGGLKAGLSEDGVHPNRAGYEVMGPLAERALQRALRAEGVR